MLKEDTVLQILDYYFEERKDGASIFLGVDDPNRTDDYLNQGSREAGMKIHIQESIEAYSVATNGDLSGRMNNAPAIKKDSNIIIIQGRFLVFFSREMQLKKMPYHDYLQTPEWQATRKRKLKQAGYKCQVCNADGKTLDVHHRTYERRGNEHDADLIVLCRDCHSTFHGNSK